MAGWTTVDYAILAVAGFVAITSLVRLMIQRRDALVEDLDQQAKHAQDTTTSGKSPSGRP